MKKSATYLVSAFTTVILCTSGGFSQSVFLRNGQIIEGKVVSENDSSLTIRTGTENHSVNRNSILRTIYNTDYKNRVTIILLDGTSLKGHIVEETRQHYIIREQLTSAREQKIAKDKVNGILKGDLKIAVEKKSQDRPGNAAIWTGKKTYKAYESIEVHFKETPGGRYDWISLAKKGSADDTHEHFDYINNQTEGTVTFSSGLPAGEYEVRLYLDWAEGSYKVSERFTFTVRE